MFDSKKIKQQKTEIENLILERDELRSSQELSTQRADRNKRRADELERKNNELVKENKDLKAKLDREESYETVVAERNKLMEEKSSNIGVIEEMETKMKTMNESMQTMTEQLESSKLSTEKATKENEDLGKEIETLKQTNTELETERGELERRIDDLEKKNNEFEDEMVKLQQEFEKIKSEKVEMNTLLEEQQEQEASKNRDYIEDLRKELSENKNKVEEMLLESEALKSENESLFRANESKKEEITEIQKELTSIKNELKIEQLRCKKIKDEWEQEKKNTEFVLVSKSAGKQRKPSLETFKEENDSEDEHVVGVIEAARAEKEELKKKENELKKRISQLQTDKEELFRSGTTLFSENKSLSAKYDQIVGERATLLQVEAALKRKVKAQEQEINDLKKTIDDLYYQNVSIRTNEDAESRRGSYVVVMGNETIKKLEREKSALHRRVKYLERENHEIESRVIELEKQSEDLVNYTRKYDSNPSIVDPETARGIHDQTRLKYTDLNRGTPHRNEINRRIEYKQRMESGRRDDRERQKTADRYFDYPPAEKPPPYDEYMNKSSRTHTIMTTRSPDYYKSNEPPFNKSPSRQTSIRSMVSLPPLGSTGSRASPRPTTLSPAYLNSKRITPLTSRR